MKISLFVVIALVVSFLAHSINMFNFPYYENDEGVYLSQAWSVLNLGQLAPYTYWYDHAPVGWLFTSLWLSVFPLLYSFGLSLNWGRVLMLVIHLLSSVFLLQIGKKLTNSYLAGAMAVIIFSLSPLGLYFQRRLLLDNLMIFWVLLSFLLLLLTPSRLSRIAGSGVAFGLAVLTKENAIFFIPGFLATIFFFFDRHHRRVSTILWLFLVASLTSLYFLFALQKGELFPYGTPIVGGSSPHVSLLGTLEYQMSRVGAGSFVQNLQLWIKQDQYLIYVGIISNLAFLVYTLVRDRRFLGFALLGPLFWIFLLKSGLTIEFYIIPLIPLLSLYIGIIFAFLPQRFPKLAWPFLISLLLFCVYQAQNSWAFAQGSTHGYRIFQSRQTAGQIQAVNWIRTYIPQNSFIVIDNYAWLDLHDPKNPTRQVYPNAHWYWKVDQDPEIKDTLLNSDPSRIDYIAKTPQMSVDLLTGISPTTTAALANSRLITSFNADGWGVEIWGTLYPRQILTRSWNYYKQRFIKEDGRVIDPTQENHTTSEGQSYALLRSVWMDDQVTFDRVLSWTQTNLQNPRGTFTWIWDPAESSSASDADVDIAMALILADRRWPGPTYKSAAQKVISGIWATEIKDNYLVPGNWAQPKSFILLNPSYLSPAAFKLFAEVDPAHDWPAVVASSYAALMTCSQETLGLPTSVFLPPNWCALDEFGIALQPTESGVNSTDYSYDAVRVMWRLALDYHWNSDLRAKNYLDSAAVFLRNKWLTDGRLLVGYTHTGADWEKYESSIGYSAAMANFSVTHPALADEIYTTKIQPKFFEEFSGNFAKSYWDDPENYYTQNWAWFSVALYSGFLKNY